MARLSSRCVLAAITFGFTVTIVTGMYLIKRWLTSNAGPLEGGSISEPVTGAQSRD